MRVERDGLEGSSVLIGEAEVVGGCLATIHRRTLSMFDSSVVTVYDISSMIHLCDLLMPGDCTWGISCNGLPAIGEYALYSYFFRRKA